MTAEQKSRSRLLQAAETIRLMQATPEPSGDQPAPELTSDEWNLVTLLVLRHAIQRGGPQGASGVLRGLVCKLLRDRSTTVALGGDR